MHTMVVRMTVDPARTGEVARHLREDVAGWARQRPGFVRILVLGGTSFVGRAVTEDALRAGAEVTLFGRGRTGTDLFPGVTRLTGDRDTGDYAALTGGPLAGGRWTR